MIPQKRDVTFRRINGRIVPIKVTKKQKGDVATGAALAAAGVGVTVGAGKAYKGVNQKSTRQSVRAFRAMERIMSKGGPSQPSFFSMASKKKAIDKAMKSLNNAHKIGMFAAPLRVGGRVAGAALLGAGAAKLYEGVKKEKLSTEKAAAIGSTAAVGAFITGSHGGAGFRQTIKPLFKKAYPHLRKFKGLLKL